MTSPPAGHLIDLRRVVKVYESAAGTFTALKGVDLRVEEGEFVAVIGKSGSGKSTLINMITGIDRPTSGEVHVAGTPVHTLGEGQMAVWRGRALGIIFQFFQLLPTLSLVENVMLPMDFAGLYAPRDRRERALRLLEQVGLAQHAFKLPSAVSGGEQQRAAIARALANDPPILVADEPTGNLDSKTAQSVFALFERLVREGKTILMVTHDNDLARAVSRTIVLSDGEIIEEYLARALPALTEAELIEVTRQVERLRFPPGAIVVRRGDPIDRLYIVTRGEVEILVKRDEGREFVAATMARGQFFGEVELLGGGPALATVRAGAETGVEVAALARHEFQALVERSTAVREAITRIARERAAEHAAAERGGGAR
ncbi:MAG: ATP-binding cassette domain-containing protein [Armatimonadota bacterium]|nr:ATP-binding cassette domain-containing protein [Armatimonadota bacterium]MDR7455218.1 ATP-binding cassette domain-containing protein [Armatimonadota bacterium]MDR7457239.1 ATP-binding cassette domain-containing protein [Armatimonadota bacterium]MDR7497257.1 ATP-binding cassette domain-containing protein [Armatimonadota bacterium]MDR7511168.1 ATP-binding cassette domain-containing protein [Armatimonadota bacterium]